MDSFEYEPEPLEKWTDEELLSAASAGNEGAFRVFVVRSVPLLWRYLRWLCRTFGMDEEKANDFTQETALRALARVRSYLEKGEPVPKLSVNWLLTIGTHLVTDAYRKTRREKAAYAAVAEIAKAQQSSQHERDQYEEVLKFFGWLKDRDREILELVFLENLNRKRLGKRWG